MKLINFALVGLLWLTAFTSSAQHIFPYQKRDIKKEISKKLPAIYKEIGKQKASGVANRNYSFDSITNLPADARVPAQYEESQAVIMTWRYNYTFDSLSGAIIFLDPANETVPDALISINLANAIQSNAKVLIRIKNWADSTIIKAIMVANGKPLTNYGFYVNDIDSWWDRDSGPISFYYSNNDSIGMIDMDYYTFEAIEDTSGFVLTDYNVLISIARIHDDSIPIKVAQYFNYPVFKTRLNNEGGNLMFDGLDNVWTSTRTREQNVGFSYGFIFDSTGNLLVDSVGNIVYDSTIKLYENYPPINDSMYEDLQLKSFNCKKMVEPETFVCDGGTGHVDIYLKLLNENTVGMVDYASAVNHTDYTAWNNNLLMLQNKMDAYGKPFNLQILPMPPTSIGTVQTDCEVDQRTYINGIFVNKTFIMPIMSNPLNMTVKDADAIVAFKKSFPGYNVTPLDVTSMYGYGGALHCITMQIPAENPVFIKHDAYTGTQPYSNKYTIEAHVKNKSGIATAIVYYRKAGALNWSSSNLILVSNNDYTGGIPGAGFVAGDTVEYFIEGKSNNGKTISKPFCAREGGANRFVISGSVNINTINATTNFVLSVYPNPTNNTVTIPVSIDNAREIKVSVTDMMGKVLYTKASNFNKGLHLIYLSKENNFINSGIYFVSVAVDGVMSKVQKVVIQ